jgi:hypothetical protein
MVLAALELEMVWRSKKRRIWNAENHGRVQGQFLGDFPERAAPQACSYRLSLGNIGSFVARQKMCASRQK